MRNRKLRNGSASLLLCILMVPLLSLLAFAVDYGFLLYIKTDLQRSVDQAALAAARDLVPDESGNQDLEKARATVHDFVKKNLGDGFIVEDNDIEIGRSDMDTIYSNVELLNDGLRDTIRVTVRRDELANTSVSLYFAKLFDRDFADITATSTAILQRGRYLGPGTEVLPFAIPKNAWDLLNNGDLLNIYGRGRITDQFGDDIPGNWGTVDVGPASNSTSDLSAQILDGLTVNDLNSLQDQGVIPTSDYIDGSASITINGDTGLSAGLKHAIEYSHGDKKIAPIYSSTVGYGGNLTFTIVGWATVEVVDSNWRGSKSSRVVVRKSVTFDGALRPNHDLSDLSNVIEGAFTSPSLIE